MHHINTFKSIFVLILILNFAGVLNAQNINKEEVTVIAPYSPIISKANNDCIDFSNGKYKIKNIYSLIIFIFYVSGHEYV